MKKILIPSMLLVFFVVPHISFAKDIVCPDGYVCLKKDDPALISSSTPCYLILQEIKKDKEESNTKNDDGSVLYQDSVSAYLKNYTEDHAGVWGVFGPGNGRLSLTKEDFGFAVNITLAKSKVVKSITITNSRNNEGWSTSRDGSIFGKSPYPLVVFDSKGKQLNNAYDQTFSLKEGKTEFTVYGQIETPGLNQSEIIIVFSDNTEIHANVLDTPIENNKTIHTFNDDEVIDNITKIDVNNTNTKGQSIWSTIKSILGF